MGADRTLLLMRNAARKRDASNEARAYNAANFWSGWIEGARMALVNGGMSHAEIDDGLGVANPVEQLIEDARSSPDCFKCGEPITEFGDVRIVTVRVDGEPKNVWVHAAHAKPERRLSNGRNQQ